MLGLHLTPKSGGYVEENKFGWCCRSLFALIGFVVSYLFGFGVTGSLVVGTMMFSSTIIGIKLLPTTVLHHQHTGEMMISVLLFQDLLAIMVLLILKVCTIHGSVVLDIAKVVVGFPLVLIFAFVFQRVCLMWLFKRFSRIKEYMFLVAIAWCLSMVELASFLKLSDEIGAFIAGVSLAASPISVYIAESLKPVRDFFLVMFFFSVGALFNPFYFSQVALPAVILGVVLFAVKPLVYHFLLTRVGESTSVAWEVGVRLGQISEFSIIISVVALSTSLIEAPPYSGGNNDLVCAVILLGRNEVPNSVALSDKLRRD